MSTKQWGHGWHRGHEAGAHVGELMGHGASEAAFAVASDRLTLLARGLQHEANAGRKSVIWWEVYASVLATQLLDVAGQLPGTLAHLHECVPAAPVTNPNRTDGSANG